METPTFQNTDKDFIPCILHKYKGEKTLGHLIRILNESTIYLANACELNDRFDLRFNVAPELYDSYLPKEKNTLNKLVSKIVRLPSMRDEFSEKLSDSFRSNAAIFSLTSDGMSESMWAYYGSEHRGYKLTFDFSNEEKWITDFVFKVNYQNEIPTVRTIEDALNSAKIKTLNWAHEQEYRILFKSNTPYVAEIININISSLVGITFGEKADLNNIEIIKTLCTSLGLKHLKLSKLKFQRNKHVEELI